MSKMSKKFLRGMKSKLRIIMISVFVVFAVLLCRVIYIGTAKGKEYTEKVFSENNYDSTTIPYSRGEIVDRNGNILATNETQYNLVLAPNTISKSTYKDSKESTQVALEKIFGISATEFNDYISRDTDYLIVMTGLSNKKVEEFDEYKKAEGTGYVVGVSFETKYKRTYPNGTLACHVLGHTSDGNVGQGGIEGSYNDYLNGVNGKKYIYALSNGETETVTVDATDGYTLVSTIDTNVQKIIEDNIEEYMNTTGAKRIGVVAMDPNNGEILGMASSYKYNPNSPMDTTALRNMTVKIEVPVSDGSSDGDYSESSEEVSSDEENSDEEETEETTEVTTEEVKTETVEYNFSEMDDAQFNQTINDFTTEQKESALNQAWRNLCISENYEPGSTYKTFTIAGALEDSVVQDGDTFFCDGGEVVVEGEPAIACHNVYGDGTLTLQQALEQSCNDALMAIAKKETPTVFDKYQDIFNMGSITGIDLAGEEPGMKYSVGELNPSELATSSFGQGVNVTMVQMASAFCSVVNGGNYYVPHVMKQVLDEDGSIVEEYGSVLVRKTISKQTSDLMKQYLKGVCINGTGTRAAVDGYSIGGKTGTAEKLPRGNGKYILSFIGCSPIENPQIVVYVIVDEPNVADQSTSGAGALLFHAIMEDLLPYMNVYQNNDDSVSYNGTDEEAAPIYTDENVGTGMIDTDGDGIPDTEVTTEATDGEGEDVEGDETTEEITTAAEENMDPTWLEDEGGSSNQDDGNTDEQSGDNSPNLDE